MGIGDLAGGTEVTVRGRVTPGREQIKSPGGVECVYWHQVGSDRRDGRPFWIDDGSGRALIDPTEAEVAARSELRDRVIRLADAELHEVEDRIRELKSARKTASWPGAPAISRELRELRQLATLLCAVRARARGNVHVGGTLEGQERYIRERSPRFSGSGSEVLRLATEVFELTLRAGDEIEVSGLVSIEPVPPELFTGGYRDLPTCPHLRPPAGGALVIRGLGEAAPRPLPEALDPEDAAASNRRPRLAWLLLAGAAIWGLIELIARQLS